MLLPSVRLLVIGAPQTLSPNSEASPIGDLLPLLHVVRPESPPKSSVMGQAMTALMITVPVTVVPVTTIPMVMTLMETTRISVMRTTISLTSLSKMTLG